MEEKGECSSSTSANHLDEIWAKLGNNRFFIFNSFGYPHSHSHFIDTKQSFKLGAFHASISPPPHPFWISQYLFEF